MDSDFIPTEDLPSVATSIAGENTLFFTFLWVVAIGILIFIGLFIVRKILHRIFAVPIAMKKKVIQVLVPKEASEKEEEKKSSKKDYKELIAVMESFYMAMGHLKPKNKLRGFLFGRDDQVSLEIVTLDSLIKFFVVMPAHLHQFFEQQIHAQYPSAQIKELEDYNMFRPKGYIAAAPLSLNKSWILPIRTYKKMDSDPLSALTNAMSKVEKNQGAAIQILVRTAPRKWRQKGLKVISEMQQGKSLGEAINKFAPEKIIGAILNTIINALLGASGSSQSLQHQQVPGMPAQQPKEYRHTNLEQEMMKSIGEKSSKVGFEVNVRVVTSADKPQLAEMNLFNISSAFAVFLGPESGMNFHKEKYFSRRALISSFIYRSFDEKRRFVLNTEELASIFHMPISSTETPNIEWLKARGAVPPLNMPKEGIVLGESHYRGKKTLVRMAKDDRRRHMYVIGMTGSGKSTIMQNMIVQDIQNGEGCCYIDPHGEAVQLILSCIPPERADDVILFEPGDIERPVGLNMLEAKTEDEKDFVTQEMISIFYKLVTDPSMIGPIFEHYMRNAMLTLMADVDDPYTIVEIPRILTDTDFQEFKLKDLTDPIIRAFWEKELPQTSGQAKGEMLPYLISKIGRFIENNMMRNIIGQPRSGFDFREAMDSKKIILVNLSKGQIGELNSNLLGLIVVSKLQMAALGRVNMPEEQRSDFYLYIDEFQNFITDSISTILSEARKYRLDLILAHQYIAQLSPKQGDTKVRDAIFGNVGTICCYRVGVDDSELMAKQMAPVFNEFDVMNIERFTTYIRLLIDQTAARPFDMKPYPPPKGDPKIAEALRQLSRLKYGRDRAIVEAEIYERSKLGEL